MNLIIVDDESFVRRSLSDTLKKANEQWIIVGEAENGLQALELLKTTSADLVISDIRMPGMDGLTLAKTMSDCYPLIKLVLLTGYHDFEYAREAIRYGVVDYLVKPSSVEDILNVINKIQNELMKNKGQANVNRIREKDLLEKRIQDWIYGYPIPYFDHTLIPNFLEFIMIRATFPQKELPLGWNEPMLLGAFKNIAEEWFHEGTQPICFSEKQELFIVIFFTDSKNGHEEERSKSISDFNHKIKQLLKLNLTITVSVTFTQLEDLATAYDSLHATTSSSSAKAKRTVIAFMVNVMEQRLHENLTLKMIAEEIYLNPTYLGRIFKDDIGESFTTFLTKLRIEKAKYLLKDITLKVFEISTMVGFNEPAYFSYIFKKQVGINPQDYQKKYYT